MSTVFHLTQFLAQQDLQQSSARSTFYQFLKYFCDREEKLHTDHLHRFYRKAFTFQHWRTHKSELCEKVTESLVQYAREFKFNFDMEKAVRGKDFQIITLDSESNFDALLGKHAKRTASSKDKTQIIRCSAQRRLLLTLNSDRDLTVQMFTPEALVHQGELVPLTPVTELFYDSELNLQEEESHTLELDGYSTARFQLKDGQCYGQLLKGHTFHLSESFSGGDVSQHFELLWVLKNLENYYVRLDADSDPYYKALIAELRAFQERLREGEPIAKPTELERCLLRARHALKSLFPEDKLLLLLTTHVEQMFYQKQQSPLKTDVFLD